MAVLKIPTNFNIDLEFEIPEFYRRLFALLIDVLIEFFYFRIALKILESIVSSGDFFDEGSNFNIIALSILLFLPILLYHVVFEITMNGQSIGKRIMRLRVVDENGGRPGISQYLIRWLLRISDVWIIFIIATLVTSPFWFGNAQSAFIILAALAFLITDIILIVSSKKGQRIGDILARTIVIRINTKADIEDTVFQEVADSYIPVFPEIMKLGDKDINAIKSILDTSRKKGDFNLAANAADKIKNHLNIKTALSPFDFLETALKDYNYLSTK
ncbi:MAG: RDD family protein [Bacteroidetes bacterium]|nr:MAG: RDD family protein [Bacteroidota bacterium]